MICPMRSVILSNLSSLHLAKLHDVTFYGYLSSALRRLAPHYARIVSQKPSQGFLLLLTEDWRSSQERQT